MFGDLQAQRRSQYEQLWTAQNELIERCKAAGGKMTQAQVDEYDSRDREMTVLQRAIKVGDSSAGAGVSAPRLLTPEDERREQAFEQYMRHGVKSPELRTQYDAGLNESGFQSSGTAGGYMVPQGFWDRLTIAQKAYNGFSEYYRQVVTTTGNPMDYPTNDPTAVLGAIIGEAVQDTYNDFTFGQGILNAWTYSSKLILASVEIVQDSAIDIASFVADRVGEAIGRAEGAHSASGTGSGQPLGIYPTLVAKGAASGASGGFVNLSAATSTNVLGGSTVTELVGNVLGPVSLANLIKAVDSAYWSNSAFYFSPSGLVAQQNLADGMGRPLYPTLSEANPSLLGFPVHVVAQVTPLTASTVSGPVFGDLQSAMVRRRVEPGTLMTLHERYADARQVGFYGFERLDHRSNDTRAISCAKPTTT